MHTIESILLNKIPSIEICKKDSLLKQQLNSSIKFTTDDNTEDLLLKEAMLYLDKLSIFRKYNPIFSQKQEFLHTKNYIVYDNRCLKILTSSSDLTAINPPTQTLTFSIKYNSKKLNKLPLYGKKLGGILASYENKIFFKSLELFNNIEKFNNSFELEDLCKSFLKLNKQGVKNFNIILPQSIEAEANMFLTEVKNELKLQNITPIYMHDFLLNLQKINAIILNKDLTNLIIKQPSSLKISGIYYNKEYYLQAAVKIGYAISGLTTASIYGYNILDKNFV